MVVKAETVVTALPVVLAARAVWAGQAEMQDKSTF
jgi:hypothetical protein